MPIEEIPYFHIVHIQRYCAKKNKENAGFPKKNHIQSK